MLAAVPSLRAFAISLSSNVDRADDLVQETLLRAMANINSFQPGTNMSAWLFTILRNLFRSEYRKRRREVEDADGRHVDSLKSPPQQHSRLEFEEFRRALAKLLPDQREALILVGASGFSYEEAAAVCDCAVGTIKSRVNRARARLSELLAIDSADMFGPGPHDACYSDRRRARLIAAARFGRMITFSKTGIWDTTGLWDGKTPPGVLFPLRSGIAIIPSPRPAFVGGKGSPCEKRKRECLHEEESQSLV